MIAWQHPHPQSTRLDAFRRHINRKYCLSLENYTQLHQWSVRELETFCAEIWTFCGLTYSAPPAKVATGIDVMWPRPQWFPGARLNYTENLLATGLAGHPDAVALSAGREGANGQWRHLTWRQLSNEVARYANALLDAGVKTGDIVAAVMTNSAEAVLVLMASAAIGAIFSSTAPDMGLTGIVERYGQVQPKLLFVDSEVIYGGKRLDLRSKLREVSRHLSENCNLERVVVVSGQLWDDPNIVPISDFLDTQPKPFEYVQLPFDHPVYILYSSGTTGTPKCICHSAGGALLQQKKEYILNDNMGLESSYYQFTTTGWMMWNYLVGALSTGARIILYDGSPLYPDPGSQIDILRQQGATHWGTSPKFLTALKQASSTGKLVDLPALELTICAGSPLSEDISSWFSSVFPRRVGLLSGSGGTDLVASIVGGTTLSTVHHGEIAAPMLGMAVEIWDETGKNIENSGEKGDLVITKPFFSMPISFWGEDGMRKYENAYFKQFPGVWCHGDYIMKNTDTGGYVILGRSDGVLNPQGIRFGTAELYGILDTFSEVLDTIAVGQHRKYEADEQVLMFLKLRTGSLNDDLRGRIRHAIKTQLSARHVPSHILQVTDVPYTMNGKKIENIVRDIVNGRIIKDTGVISNPECLAQYHKFVSLSGATEEKVKPKL